MTHILAKELPVVERPYEKCLLAGPGALSDAELLAVVLKTGNKDMNVIQLAQLLLKDGSQNLLNLYDYSLDELMNFPGIGPVKAVQLKCIAEAAKRISSATRRNRLTMACPSTIADYYMERMRHEPNEQMIVSCFDAKCHLLADALISTGTVTSVMASPREVFLKALSLKAVYIILLHNHPSGVASPSKEDILLTKRMKECGELLDIELSDHIIIGDNNYYSFRENGML
ncbi:MAG: DNA repair protein RadC [bacterium]|nr:DNA repair protein RadC [bacterium]